MSDWSAPVSNAEAARRAGGRKRWNAWRRWMAFYRRCEISRLLFSQGSTKRGFQAKLARTLNVARSTISRDIAKLLEDGARRCPLCQSQQWPPPKRFDYCEEESPDGR
jgi:hypothetical protein